MALGTTLKADLKVALANSDNAVTSSNNIASAINDYLSGAEYGEGSLTYSSSVAGSGFLLALPGDATTAATQWANTVMLYWGPLATGTPGTPTQEASVVAGTIAGATVAPALLASLTTIFSNVGGTLDSKAEDIAGAIEDAVATIEVAWTEISPPASAVPFTGGVS